MKAFSRAKACALFALLLLDAFGCTNLGALKGPAGSLGTAIATTADAQETIYDNEDQSVTGVEQAWKMASEDLKTRLASSPLPRLPPASLQLRRDLLENLKTYGTLMTAIATGTENNTLDSNAEALALSLRDLQSRTDVIGDFINKRAGLANFDTKLNGLGLAASGSTGTAINLVVAAFDTLARFFIDNAKARKLQQVARELDTSIKTLAALLSAEDVNIASTIDQNDKNGIYAARDLVEKGLNFAQRNTYYQARDSIEARYAPLIVPADAVPILAAWDATARANHAVLLAEADMQGLVDDAQRRAKEAIIFYKGLQTKTK